MFERAIELDPHDVHPLINLGWIYFELGSLKEAEKIYLQALKVNPIADVYNKLGLVSLKPTNNSFKYHKLSALSLPEVFMTKPFQAIWSSRRVIRLPLSDITILLLN